MIVPRVILIVVLLFNVDSWCLTYWISGPRKLIWSLLLLLGPHSVATVSGSSLTYVQFKKTRSISFSRMFVLFNDSVYRCTVSSLRFHLKNHPSWERCRILRIALNHSSGLWSPLGKYGSLLTKESVPRILHLLVVLDAVLKLNTSLTTRLGLFGRTLLIIRGIGVVAIRLESLAPRFVTNKRLVLAEVGRTWTYSSLRLRPRLRFAWLLALLPFFFGVAFLTPFADTAAVRLRGVPAAVVCFPLTLK